MVHEPSAGRVLEVTECNGSEYGYLIKLLMPF